MNLKLIEDSGECVTLEELKAHLRIDFHDQDALLNMSISAARVFIEEYLNRSLLNKTFELWLNSDELGALSAKDWAGVRHGSIAEIAGNSTINLRTGKVQQIVHVKSYGQGNDELDFDSSNYFLDEVSEPGRIVLNYGATWPTDLRYINALKIRFKAGYGTSPSSVPAPLLNAVKFLAAHFYDEGCDDCNVPKSVFMLLNPYRIFVM
jgi:hypothetical protein